MKKLLLTAAAAALVTSGAALAGSHSKEVKIGVIFGFTGPIESLTPPMAAGAELAMKEVNDSGKFGLGTVTAIRADSTCVDSAASTAAMERLVTSDGIAAVVGGDCSGVTGAMLQNVARPNGIVMISPSATSPALSTAEDDGLFFRTSPSDARGGEVGAAILMERGAKSIAITYTNNDYGKGLSDSLQAAFEAMGGTVTINAAHEDGKGDYSAEVGALAAAGGDVLAVIGYLDGGGSGVIRSALDLGAFDTFYLPDGMIGDTVTANFGADIDGSFGALAGTDSPGASQFSDMASADGFDGTSSYTGESYDAAALIMLSMAAANSTDSKMFKDKVLDIANAPGEKIYPGELAKALEIIAGGGDVDYVGASAVELIGPGESAGSYREVDVKGGALVTNKYR